MNKATVTDRDRQAIAGIQKHYANAPPMTLDGVSYTMAAIKKVLQGQIDAAPATAAAKAAYRQAVVAEQAASAEANALYRALKVRVLNDFKNANDVLGDFGMLPQQKQVPSAATVAEAVQKRASTRQARGTAGKRQKAKIKGAPAAPATSPAPPAGSAQAAPAVAAPAAPAAQVAAPAAH